MRTLFLIALCVLTVCMTGCRNNKVESVEINKGETEVTRTEDALYEQAGENPFQSDFREKQEEINNRLAVGKAETGLKIEDLKLGTGDMVEDGDTVSVHYKGTLENGEEFDSSYKHGKPFGFTVGKDSVIQGWEQGIKGMQVGGKRKLTIPPSLGYGDADMPGIPPNSTLIFEIELLGKE
ncbi:MAG: FKBP-type peptidyl-prolyl cis-trans isomerase [Abditibacteriota bacterium]|nr:FKBP-type peptidyl-prolyl cis-trans isomerase [Abditibacteriota bacterium]